MSQRIVIELPDDVFRPVEEIARAAGQPLEQWIVSQIGAVPSVAVRRSDGRGIPSLIRHAGSVSIVDPRGADNTAIDDDLGREYGATHDKD